MLGKTGSGKILADLHHLAKKGDERPLQYYKSLVGWQQKKDFGMTLIIHRDEAMNGGGEDGDGDGGD